MVGMMGNSGGSSPQVDMQALAHLLRDEPDEVKARIAALQAASIANRNSIAEMMAERQELQRREAALANAQRAFDDQCLQREAALAKREELVAAREKILSEILSDLDDVFEKHAVLCGALTKAVAEFNAEIDRQMPVLQ